MPRKNAAVARHTRLLSNLPEQGACCLPSVAENTPAAAEIAAAVAEIIAVVA